MFLECSMLAISLCVKSDNINVLECSMLIISLCIKSDNTNVLEYYTNCQNEAMTILAADNSDWDEEKQSGKSFSLRHPTFKVATKLPAIRSFSIRKLLIILI